MASDEALRAADKLKKSGLECAVMLDGAKPPESGTDPPPETEGTYQVILKSYNTEQKVAAIKAVRSALDACGLPVPSLSETTSMLSSLPCVIKGGMEKADAKALAEQLGNALSEVGAVVSYSQETS